MEIRVAKTAGFCFGVKRAVDLTYGLLNEGCKVATLGPLIHNPQAVEDMQKKGALVADAIADVPAGYEVVIRSHGVPRTVYDELDARGITYHDATCPFVQKIQRIAAEAEKAGAVLLVAGDKTHPEVQGIVGHTRGEVFVFADLAELKAWKGPSDPQKPLFAVAQTTFVFGQVRQAGGGKGRRAQGRCAHHKGQHQSAYAFCKIFHAKGSTSFTPAMAPSTLAGKPPVSFW